MSSTCPTNFTDVDGTLINVLEIAAIGPILATDGPGLNNIEKIVSFSIYTKGGSKLDIARYVLYKSSESPSIAEQKRTIIDVLEIMRDKLINEMGHSCIR